MAQGTTVCNAFWYLPVDRHRVVNECWVFQEQQQDQQAKAATITTAGVRDDSMSQFQTFHLAMKHYWPRCVVCLWSP